MEAHEAVGNVDFDLGVVDGRAGGIVDREIGGAGADGAVDDGNGGVDRRGLGAQGGRKQNRQAECAEESDLRAYCSSHMQLAYAGLRRREHTRMARFTSVFSDPSFRSIFSHASGACRDFARSDAVGYGGDEGPGAQVAESFEPYSIGPIGFRGTGYRRSLL